MAIYIAQKRIWYLNMMTVALRKKKRFRVLMKAESGITSVF